MMKLKLVIFLICSFPVFSETLFVCQGNTARSYIAEAISKKILYHNAFSRGLKVKSLLPEPGAVEALAQWNVFYHHDAQEIKGVDMVNADLVLTMTLEQKNQLKKSFPQYQNKIYTLSECAHGQFIDVPDPFGKDLSMFKKIRDQIFLYEDAISSRGWTCKSRSK